MLHMPLQVLGVYPPIAILTNVLLAALNGLRLLASVALLGDLANVLDTSLAKSLGIFLEAPRVEARMRRRRFCGCWWLCEEGIDRGCVWLQRFSVGDMPPSEELQEIIEKMTVWVS